MHLMNIIGFLKTGNENMYLLLFKSPIKMVVVLVVEGGGGEPESVFEITFLSSLTCDWLLAKHVKTNGFLGTKVILDNLCEGGRMVQIVLGVLSKPSKADGNYCPSHRGGNYSTDGEQRIRRWENFLSGTFQLSALLFQHLVGERDKRETVLISNLEILRCF